MPEQRVAPYGSWESPITADVIVSEGISLSSIKLDGPDTYWIEGRPSEGGRAVIVRREREGRTSDVIPAGFNARTRVHEYGGGAYTVADDTLFFSNFDDNRLYRMALGSDPQAVTSNEARRYADLIVDSRRDRLICVREDHTDPGREAVNTIVGLDLARNREEILASGNDFYSSPRLSPDGSRLAWLTWSHPNMPWDGSELWVGELTEQGSVDRAERVAGGPGESIFQPEWSPDGRLAFVSDRSGWWNLYLLDEGKLEALAPMEAEFGMPQWVFGMSTYAFAGADRIICRVSRGGRVELFALDLTTRQLDTMETPYTDISGVEAVPERVVFIGGSPTEASSVVQVDLAPGRVEVLRRSTGVEVEDGYLSRAEPIEFPTENGMTAFGLYYAPHNRDYRGPESERPPLLVEIHGGPTSASGSSLDLEVQYWTSRGFAFLDVNYGGSTGYGREYRERLNGQWGVVDVDDAANGASFLAERGQVDPGRLVIRGGSAGGYTTLAALAFRDVFAAGASYFGIADLDPFVDDTHKFESRYTERLVGPYPEARDLYYKRSPIHFVHQVTSPVILFQGLDDKVVTPKQAEIMVQGLKEHGVPHAYVPFAGEGHGFRKAENIKRSLENELSFYSQIFVFPLPKAVEAVSIENLKRPNVGAASGGDLYTGFARDSRHRRD